MKNYKKNANVTSSQDVTFKRVISKGSIPLPLFFFLQIIAPVGIS